MYHALSRLLLASSLVAVSSAAFAQEAESKFLPGDFAATAALTTDYVFRGVSQTDDGPAAQAGLTYKQAFSEAAGFYIGAWGSNVDFNDGDEANVELDYIAGVTYGIDNWSFDVGGIYYSYPGADEDFDYDFFEAQATVGYDLGFATVLGAVFYSPEFFADSGDAVYAKAAAEVPLPYDLKLIGSVGHQWIEDNGAAGIDNYYNWSAGVKYNLQGLDLAAEYNDTDVSGDNTESRIVFTASKSF